MKTASCFAFLAVPFVVMACGAADGGSTSGSERGASQPQNLSPPSLDAVQTHSGVIAVRATPGATCSLRLAGSVDASKSIPLYADFEGTVRLHATLPTNLATSAVLDCTKDGQVQHFDIDLSSPDLFAPAPAPTVSAKYKIRRPLAESPDTATPATLRAGGYPRKPDAKRSPAMYDRWLEAVSQPTKIVDAAPVNKPGVYYGTGQSFGGDHFPWFGAELNAPVAYTGILAGFIAPPLSYDPNNVIDEVSFWAGLGGDSNSGGNIALLQDGVTAIGLSNFLGPGTLVQLYELWTEYFPLVPDYISSIVPNNNDSLLVEAYPGDANGTLDFTGGFGCFFVEDVTQALSTSTCKERNPNVPGNECVTGLEHNEGACAYEGTSAELMGEIQANTSGQQDYPLADFGTYVMAGFAGDTNGNTHDFGTDPVILYTSLNATNRPAIVSADQVQVTWKGFWGH
jgi:hypothetical protein